MNAAVGTTDTVVVSCAGSGELHVLALDARDGTLRTRQVVQAGGMLMPIAIRPSKTHLYVARRSDPLAVLTFAIGSDGKLTQKGESALPASMAYLSCDRSGRWLMAASYHGHCVAIGPIGDDGVEQAPRTVIPTGRHPHAIVMDADNRFAYVPQLGESSILMLRLDVDTGSLIPVEPATTPCPPGSGPRHLVHTPRGDRVYVLHELDGHVALFSRDASSGSLTLRQRMSIVPAELTEPPWAAELRLSADGSRLFATERRSSTASVMAVDPANGTLSLLAQHEVERQPRGMQVTPDGRHLLVAGQLSGAVACHAVDGRSGTLALRSRLAVGEDPNWIEVLGPFSS
jgi:6-phosphogluconolactonase